MNRESLFQMLQDVSKALPWGVKFVYWMHRKSENMSEFYL